MAFNKFNPFEGFRIILRACELFLKGLLKRNLMRTDSSPMVNKKNAKRMFFVGYAGKIWKISDLTLTMGEV